MKLLEIFKGTGSVGKVAKKFNFDVISVDYDAKFNPDIETDILKWDYKKFYKETGFIPDFIWASPPCNTFSPLVYPLRERDTKTARPKSKRAKIGTAILYKTLEIISFFNRKNKHMGFCIENPRGMMRQDPKMKKLQMETTYYCLYGDNRRKPTDFWSNFKLNLITTDEGNQAKVCRNTVGVVDVPLCERYKIPSRLIKHIFNMYLVALKKNKSL